MCVVSMIGDHYGDRWRPYVQPVQLVVVPDVTPRANTWVWTAPITREEFDALKRDVEEMKALLVKAKAYDEEHGEPDCELEGKLAILRAVAAAVGVDLDDVFSKVGPEAGE